MNQSRSSHGTVRESTVVVLADLRAMCSSEALWEALQHETDLLRLNALISSLKPAALTLALYMSGLPSDTTAT
jgi:hypothetical protein